MELSQLTIIVPTRNEAHNIPFFLNSLPPTINLIVVDASLDGTSDLVKTLRSDATLVISHPGHIAEARTRGAEVAHTPWLLFTDADIVFPPHYFDRLAAYLNYDACYGPKLSTDEFARYYRWFGWGQQVLHSLSVPAISGSNLLVKRRVLMEVGGFDLGLTCNEDSELGWRLKRSGYQIAFAPDLVVYACDHRRLRLGLARKTFHSLIRCSLLYLNLIPHRWRSRDWGYWAHQPDSKTLLTEERILIKQGES